MAQPQAPRLLIEITTKAVVATFKDERIVDEIVIDAIGQQLYNLVEKEGQTRLLLNFSNVRSMTTGMLAKLFKLRGMIDQARGKLKLCCIGPDIRSAFKMFPQTRFEIFDDEQKALDTF